MATLFKDMEEFDRLPKAVRDFINDSVCPPNPEVVRQLLDSGVSENQFLAGVKRGERTRHMVDAAAGVIPPVENGNFQLRPLRKTRRLR